MSTQAPKAKALEAAADFDVRTVFVRLLSYLWLHKPMVAAAIAFMVCTALTEAGFAAMIKPIINDGFVNANAWHL